MRDDQVTELESAVEGRASSDRTSRARRVYDALCRMIQDGRYGSGDRMREEEIARRLVPSSTRDEILGLPCSASATPSRGAP